MGRLSKRVHFVLSSRAPKTDGVVILTEGPLSGNGKPEWTLMETPHLRRIRRNLLLRSTGSMIGLPKDSGVRGSSNPYIPSIRWSCPVGRTCEHSKIQAFMCELYFSREQLRNFVVEMKQCISNDQAHQRVQLSTNIDIYIYMYICNRCLRQASQVIFNWTLPEVGSPDLRR